MRFIGGPRPDPKNPPPGDSQRNAAPATPAGLEIELQSLDPSSRVRVCRRGAEIAVTEVSKWAARVFAPVLGIDRVRHLFTNSETAALVERALSRSKEAIERGEVAPLAESRRELYLRSMANAERYARRLSSDLVHTHFTFAGCGAEVGEASVRLAGGLLGYADAAHNWLEEEARRFGAEEAEQTTDRVWTPEDEDASACAKAFAAYLRAANECLNHLNTLRAQLSLCGE